MLRLRYILCTRYLGMDEEFRLHFVFVFAADYPGCGVRGQDRGERQMPNRHCCCLGLETSNLEVAVISQIEFRLDFRSVRDTVVALRLVTFKCLPSL